MMNILHIARIDDNKFNGVNIVVPQHILAQEKIENVALLNIFNIEIEGLENQFYYSDNIEITTLSEPFNNPDIVIFHQTYVIQYLRLANELKKRRIPYVIVPHGDLTTGAQHKKWLKKKVANLLLFNRFINGAVAIQNLSQQEMNSTDFGKHRFIGTNGINIPSVHKETFRSKSMKFVYIGRLDAYHKGLDLFIKAVASESEFLRENNCRFYIYGPDKNGRFENVESLIHENKVETLIYLSHEVSGEEKENILLDADVFFQTSRFEGMPMGILEALGYGIPCLITKGTCLGDIVEKYNAGWVAENKMNSIADNIIQSVKDIKKLNEKSVNARGVVSEHFSWDIIAEKIVYHYRELVKNGR